MILQQRYAIQRETWISFGAHNEVDNLDEKDIKSNAWILITTHKYTYPLWDIE